MKTSPSLYRYFAPAALAALALLAPWSGAQQLNPPAVGSTPAPLTPAVPAVPAVPAPAGAVAPAAPAPELPVSAPATAPVPVDAAPPAAPAPAAVASIPARSTGGGIMLNFQGASLKDVLNYLSDAAGFVIVQEVPVTGTVNIVSRQPIGAEDAVDLLNTVLSEKGFTAIRNGRILKIVNRKDAPKRDLPVEMGSDPDHIPRNDAIVTQILPLRFGEAAKVIENLRPLLSDNATVSANEASNAIIMTDTQTNIRRIAQILHALDTSVSSISTITVFQLEFADAKAVAETITQLYSTTQQSGGAAGGRGGGGRGGFGALFGGFGGGGPGGGGGAPGAGATQSEARLASTKVVAVSDEQSNSVIVSSPEAMVPGIRELIQKIDISINDVTQTRIFRLSHADSVELADILNNLFSDSSSQRSRSQTGNNNGRQRGGGFGFGQPQAQTPAASQSERSLLQAKVVAVGDPRTNSLVVTAANDTMLQIEDIVKRLDATEAKKQHVYIHSLQHADADTVAGVLRGMLSGDTTGNTAQSALQNTKLGQRQLSGASTDATLGSSNGVGSGSGSGRSSR